MNAMMKLNDIVIKYDEPMSKHTSWRTGGAAKQFVEAKSLDALALFMASLPVDENLLWMGLGSNTLVRDTGFNGTVIATQGVMSQLTLIDANTVYVGAGVAGAKLARFCGKNNLQGAEFFAGIPGLMGGALAMNAGAFGGETWPLIVEVETINRKGKIQTRKVNEFTFGYRYVEGPVDEWFVSATLRLQKRKDESDSVQSNNTIDIKRLLAKRSASQPIGVASCGSVFRNPKGDYAARLIEACGLKGKRVGGAVVSEKHANFIINEASATANDIESLIKLIQKTVQDKCQIILQPEVRIVGEIV